MPVIFSPVVISRSKWLRLVRVKCIVQVAHVISASESRVFDFWTRLSTFRCGIRKLGQVLFFADFWDCYWVQGKRIGQQLTGASLVTIPEVLAKTNSAHLRFLKDGAHYCYCAHFLRLPRQSRATRKKCTTRRTRGLVLSPVSLGGSSYFLWKRCVVFQQMKNNFYLPCQFFENRRSMRMLLFLRMIDLTEHFIVKQKSILKHQKLLLQDVTLRT